MTHSSGTQQRFEIPSVCPRCKAEGTVEFRFLGGDGTEARVKCSACNRAWWIDPTPIWEIADRAERLAKAAPELLAACRVGFEQIGRLILGEECDHEANLCWCEPKRIRAEMNAAIAKATGEPATVLP